jgi:ParB-like chromosome segregation protein Spo0J
VPSIPVSEVIPYARNARRHPAEQIDRLCDSLRRFGFVAPVLIDADGVVIAGHGRLLAAKALWAAGVPIPRCADGMVPVVQASTLTPAQVKAYRIADNKLASLSAFDDAALAATLRELTEGGFPASALGFSDEELRILVAEEPAPDDGAPEEPDGGPITGEAADPYSLLTFSCLATTVQRDAIFAALERARERQHSASVGDALVAVCRRYVLQ